MNKPRVILFGASSMGETAYVLLKDKYDVVHFCDNDKEKWGNKFCDILIISPELLKLKKYNDIEIIITSTYHREISIQLKNMGLSSFKSFEFMAENYKKRNNLKIEIKEEFKDLIKIDDTIDNLYDKKETLSHSYNNLEDRNLNLDNKLKVACILDEFSYSSFKNECDLVKFNPGNWIEVLNQKIDFLFVESAWNGNDGEWGNMSLLSSDNSFGLNTLDTIFNNIIEYCEKKSIPTVFWNKEDPVHYDHFISLAKRFQFVFTTDENIIPRYIEDVGHERVYALPFGANIKIHNPINKNKAKIGNIAFAGSWYNYHEDRKVDMKNILLPSLDYGVHIYDRNYGMDSKGEFDFPEVYKDNIVGKLPYDKMIEYYKKYTILLNVNTVQNSPTMFSRRVFEFLACGTNVISGYSLGVEKMLGDVVLISKSSEETKLHIEKLINNQEFSQKLSILGVRKIIESHTYTHRFNNIVDKLKISNIQKNDRGVSIISVLTDYKQIENIIYNYNNQNYNNKELIIIIKNNDIERLSILEYGKDNEKLLIYKVEDSTTLAECLNYGISRSSKRYIAIFDEKDYYGGNYLTDMLNVFEYSEAKVIGKKSIFRYIIDRSQMNIINISEENTYSNEVFSSTLVIDKNIFLDNMLFVEDNDIYERFFKECKEKNIKIYSTDKYNYINYSECKEYTLKEESRKYITFKEAIDYVNI